MNKNCKEIRKQILGIATESGHGHIPTCFSIVEMVFATYSVMNHNPHIPSDTERDYFVLSKGHGALAQYCVLANLGYFDIKDVYSFGCFGSKFGCHADRLKIPGIEVSTGSLGHGIGVATGMALGLRIKKRHDKNVFVLIGDGESNEGSVWEAIMVACDLKLNNLTIIYDHNLSQLRGLQLNNPVDRFRGFGCEVFDVNGHDLEELESALKQPANTVKVIVANTQKGHGCKTLIEEKYAWHRRSPSRSELEILLKELG